MAHFDVGKGKRPLILASASPRRQDLLRQLGLIFTVCPSEVPEPPLALPPPQLVTTLARLKAEAVGARQRAGGGLVLGADTMVTLAGECMGKPRDAREAEAMLARLAGRTHEVYTGVALLDLERDKLYTDFAITRVTLRPLSATTIKRYVATGEPLDKAGAYGIQGRGACLVERIEGCYFNVVGLPLALVTRLLEECGVEVI